MKSLLITATLMCYFLQESPGAFGYLLAPRSNLRKSATGCFSEEHSLRNRQSTTSIFSTSADPSQETLLQPEPSRIYFDIGLGDEDVGRLVFNLKGSEQLLPLHVENLTKLCTGALQSIDPKICYNKCAFKFSPQFIEGFPQYKWAHVLDGRGRNAVGRPTERISDPANLRACTHSMYGGVYYGLEYSDEMAGDYGVLLTVPLAGPKRGSTGFSIVRVRESPQEWRERLLLNSAVLGYLESGIDVLHRMARQTEAPPTITASGRL
mmetsp:Transcript_13024/g.21374  ORF Transcript_13024/g.21374 Transcript_13024/m.21374 type:complete len:265 (+) Transcript_13024:62-856(+)